MIESAPSGTCGGTAIGFAAIRHPSAGSSIARSDRWARNPNR
jgi:hypothetical protein